MSIKADLQRPPETGRPIIGQEIDAPERFAPDTRHMVLFDVITEDDPAGDGGGRVRVFLTDEGYGQTLDAQERGELRIVHHVRVNRGFLFLDMECDRG
jgi:hypothetical protein